MKPDNFSVEMPSTVSAQHSNFKLNHARRFQDINFHLVSLFIFSVSSFIFFCCHKGVTVTIQWKWAI